MRIGTLREWIKYSIILGVFLLILPPFFTNASQEDADKMCAKAKPECPCAEVKNKQTGKCEKKSIEENPFMCPLYCKDDTNGHKTVGHCEAPSKCKGDTCDGKPCEQSKPPEMPKMPEMPKDSPPPPSTPSPCSATGTGSKDVTALSPETDRAASSTSATSTVATSTPPCPSSSAGSNQFGSSYSPSQYSGTSASLGNYSAQDPNSVFSDALSGLADQSSQSNSSGQSNQGFAGASLSGNIDSLSSGSDQGSQGGTLAVANEISAGVTGFGSPRTNGQSDSGFTGQVLSAAKAVYNYAANVASSAAKAAANYVYSATSGQDSAGNPTDGASSNTAQNSMGTQVSAGATSSATALNRVRAAGSTSVRPSASPTSGTSVDATNLLQRILIGIFSIIHMIIVSIKGIFV